MIYLDTETCGLYGQPVIIQWATETSEINIHEIWRTPILETINLIDMFMEEGVCAFNIVFDQFMLCKIYTLFTLALKEGLQPTDLPIDHIDYLGVLEKYARDEPCLKPRSAFDLLLHARKGVYQSTMERDEIRIKRVPVQLAEMLADYLEQKITFPDIYFARKSDPKERKWKVLDIKDADTGEVDNDFCNIVLRFAPSAKLKVLVKDALGYDDSNVINYTDIEVDPKFRPVELGYAPYALAVGDETDWKWSWPQVIVQHILHWAHNKRAREYAAKDVQYLRELYDFFGRPEINDTDSVLACMVAAVRWRGFRVDIEGLKRLKNEATIRAKETPTAPGPVKQYVLELLDPTERLIVGNSTKKVILEEIATWEDHPAAVRAKEVLEARSAQKEIELYDKLIHAERFHASLNVIGTRSSRMSGSDKLNPQGIKATKSVRKCFPLFWAGQTLSGGDFESFEVCIMEAVYNDPKLRSDLFTCADCKNVVSNEAYLSGVCNHCGAKDSLYKIHGLFAMELFPGHSYEDILATKGTENDLYYKGKRSVFALGYGGDENTLKDRVGVPLEIAAKACQNFGRKYKRIGEKRKEIIEKFCSMRQPSGIGTQVVWHDPQEYVESLLGFRRYFTLENRVCKTLFEIANKPPQAWLQSKVKVVRRDREQTVAGAVRSALFSCAFQIQAANMRAAGNHEIQSTGAQITKETQRRIWDIQPHGYHDFKVMPLNIHDEILCPNTCPEVVAEVVSATVEEFRPIVPLIKIDWHRKMNSWAEK